MKSAYPARNRFPIYYEVMIWVVYVILYKYSYYLERYSAFLRGKNLPSMPRENFPLPVLILFAVAVTLYIFPYYRLIAPRLLARRRYGWFAAGMFVYILLFQKLTGWLVTAAFGAVTAAGPLQAFYSMLHREAAVRIDLVVVFTDGLAFLTVIFVRFGFDNEQKKHLLERDNLSLQLNALKAQLNPHFLFNTLNSLYGMSLAGVPETPAFILRLSDMMRYILYDCGEGKVALEKDLAFLGNYLELEKKRYPEASTAIDVRDDGSVSVLAPLLFIPFVENAFKHGAHRMSDGGYIRGELAVSNGVIRFFLRNNVYSGGTRAAYGGVGIANVRQRLNLVYPGKHELRLGFVDDEYRVGLVIHTI